MAKKATKKATKRTAAQRAFQRLALQVRDNDFRCDEKTLVKFLGLFVRANGRRIAEEAMDRAVRGDIVALALIEAHLKEPVAKMRRRRPREVRRRIIGKFDFVCQHCQKHGTVERGPDGLFWTLDHFIPLSRGGSNGESNLILSCWTCNFEKGDSLPDERKTNRVTGDETAGEVEMADVTYGKES